MSGGPFDVPREINVLPADAPALVLILPGIIGPTGDEIRLQREFDEYRDDTGEKIGDVQFWNWTRTLRVSAMHIFSGRFQDRLYEVAETKAAAHQLALQLEDWRKKPDQKNKVHPRFPGKAARILRKKYSSSRYP